MGVKPPVHHGVKQAIPCNHGSRLNCYRGCMCGMFGTLGAEHAIRRKLFGTYSAEDLYFACRLVPACTYLHAQEFVRHHHCGTNSCAVCGSSAYGTACKRKVFGTISAEYFSFACMQDRVALHARGSACMQSHAVLLAQAFILNG